jgi:hypothetical protein
VTIRAVPCQGHPGCVDLIDDRYPEDGPDGDVLHLTAAGWAEFVAAVKAGKYDNVTTIRHAGTP